MFLYATFTVFLGCLCNICQGESVCSCKNSGGCITDNRCWPSAINCLTENVALGKQTYMNSYYSSQNEKSGSSCLAVNGNRSHTLVLNPNGDDSRPGINCVHTSENGNDPLWSVDLGGDFTVTNITIYNRISYQGRLNGAQLRVDNKPCVTIQDGDHLIININCDEPVRGRNVTLKKTSGMLNFCELEVWVCTAGHYGPACSEQCMGNCKNETCDNYYGTCPNGCKEAFYGDFCNLTCGHCQDVVCDQQTGECPSGCEAGWEGLLCNKSCSAGFYDHNCNKTCGQCTAGNTTCNITTGVCQDGCQTGYVTPFCNETCAEGFYGDNCTYICGNCSEGPRCNPVNGVCPSGCRSGYKAPFCNETCPQGLYGKDCNDTCGRCADGNACHPETGVCAAGCQKGYQPSLCNATCSGGYYGDNCTYPCGECLRPETCHHVNGTCPGGCQGRYEPPFCHDNCTAGRYGDNCANSCGKCAHDSACDPISGDCPSGCQRGYQGRLCNKTCNEGYHGDKCNLTCGHCAEGRACHHETGVCPSGCQSGYQNSLCDARMGVDDGVDAGVNAVVAGGVSAAVVFLLILAGVVVFIVIRRKRLAGQKPEMVHAPDTRGNRTQTDYKSLPVSTAKDETNSKPSAHVLPIVKPSAIHEKVPTPRADDRIYMNVMSQGEEEPAVSADNSALAVQVAGEEPAEFRDNDDSVYFNDNVYATFKASNPQLDSVQRSLVDILASDELPGQFKQLPKGLADSHQVGKLQANIKKNRYTSVLPYDHSRVILKDGYSKGTATDYINASYISGFQHEKKYIATQGPRDHTVGDFWRMVWQEEITQIVMLTNTTEAGQNKCSEYWPAKNSTVTYGCVTVSGVDVQRRADYIVRTFLLKKHDDPEEREVEQYHYLAWPDHGTPSITSLLNFWRFARARAPQSPPPPVIVHCTAGVGRTGTYLGLDIAFDEAVAMGTVNVLGKVTRMRKERCIMVQTLTQYIFLHKVLLEAYTGRGTTFSLDKFESSFPEPVSARRQNPRIDDEFQRIMQMRSLTSEEACDGAREKENIEKNRDQSALPSDQHRVYLTAHVPERNQYINAVYMSEYFASRGRILTQLPLPNTLVDFWRLVDGNDVTTIVSLGSVTEAKGKDFCQYWPVDLRTIVQADPYMVKLTNSSTLGSHLTSFELSVERKGSNNRHDVCLVRFEGWSEETPENISELLSLMSFLEERRQSEEYSCPVIIQCLDGVTKSGLFSVLCDVISRLTHDKEIDVYTTVRELHRVRPQALTSVVQYRYCYEVAQHRHSEMNVYANTS